MIRVAVTERLNHSAANTQSNDECNHTMLNNFLTTGKTECSFPYVVVKIYWKYRQSYNQWILD